MELLPFMLEVGDRGQAQLQRRWLQSMEHLIRHQAIDYRSLETVADLLGRGVVM
jgi:hypothetical protein